MNAIPLAAPSSRSMRPFRGLFARLAILAAILALAGPAAALRTDRVILVTVDGVRVQEMFGGIDDVVMADKSKSGVENPPKLRRDYGRDTPEARREAIMPFFWGTLAPTGVVLGNAAKGSRVVVTNARRVSYPGYAEIVVGKAHPAILGNTPVRNFDRTVLEIVRERLGLPYEKVAAYASWTTFNFILSKDADAVFCNAGYERVEPAILTEGMKTLDDLQFEMMTPWDGARHDAITAGLALEHLRAHEPKLLMISLDETDDWAHARRYDRVIHAIGVFDRLMRDLSAAIESMDEYRGRTSIVVTTDHGRGITPEDWTSHGPDVPRADEMWIAVFGPDTPARGDDVPGEFTQAQVAATVAKFLGIDYAKEQPDSGPPLEVAFGGE